MRESPAVYTHTVAMLRFALLTASCVLCIAKVVPLVLRHDEQSARGHDSSLPHHCSSLLHSHLHLHGNETKQHRCLNSKFSRDKVAAWKARDANAAENSGKRRREKQVDEDKWRYRDWISNMTAHSRATNERLTEVHHSGTSPYTLEMLRPNRVNITSNKPHTLLSKASNRKKPSTAVHRHPIDMQMVKKTQSWGLKTEQSETRSRRRRRRRRRSDVSDNNFETFSSNEMLNRGQLSLSDDLRSTDEDEMDFSYDDELGEDNERKDERDLEESIQKRQSDEIMISRAVLDAMNERIYSRVKDFIDKNTSKKMASTAEIKEAEKKAVPVAEIKEASTLIAAPAAAIIGATSLPELITPRPTLPP